MPCYQQAQVGIAEIGVGKVAASCVCIFQAAKREIGVSEIGFDGQRVLKDQLSGF